MWSALKTILRVNENTKYYVYHITPILLYFLIPILFKVDNNIVIDDPGVYFLFLLRVISGVLEGYLIYLGLFGIFATYFKANLGRWYTIYNLILFNIMLIVLVGKIGGLQL